MDIKALQEHFDGHHAATKKQISDVLNEVKAASARLDDMEQKAARHGPSGDYHQGKSLGGQFVGQPGLQDFIERRASSDRFQFETKATITSATADAAGSAGAGALPYNDPIIAELRRRRPMIRDLLNVVPITTGSVEMISMKGRTNNAAPVAEGAAKPQSDLQLTATTVTAKVIAHWMKASRQVLDDVPQLQGLINTDLLDGLALAEETQLLFGDGTGQNLNGLTVAATAYAAPITLTDDNGEMDQLFLALLQSGLNLYPATGIILNPADWQRLLQAKNGNGDYLMGPPGQIAAQRLGGVPVITTPAMTVDKFLVGDFRSAATLYDRWTARVEVGTINDDFTKNLVTILAEERVALAVRQPTALIYGDFGNV